MEWNANICIYTTVDRAADCGDQHLLRGDAGNAGTDPSWDPTSGGLVEQVLTRRKMHILTLCADHALERG